MPVVTPAPDAPEAAEAPSLSPKGTPAGWPQILLIRLGSSLPVLGTVVLTPVVHSIEQAFASDPAAKLAPLVLAVPALFIGLLAPFAGQIVDRLGRKRLLLAAMVAYTLFGTAPLYLDDLRLILLSRALMGIVEAAVMTVCITLISDYFTGPKRVKVIGLQTGSSAVAAIVFVAVGGALGAAGWRAPFAVYGIALLLLVPMAILLWEPQREHMAEVGRLPRVPWRELRVPLAVTVLGAIMFYVLQVGLSYLVSREQATVIGTLGSIATAAMALSFGRLAGRGIRFLLPLAFGLGGVGLLVTVAGGSPIAVGAGYVLTSLGGGLMLPTLLNWSVNSLAFEQRGRGTGLWTGCFFLSQFVCGALISAANASPDGLDNLLWIIAAVCLVMTVGTFVGTRRFGRTATTATAEA
jgi:MFS family permease